MAHRRSKKSPLKRRIQKLRKLPKSLLAYRPPHSSVFVIGIGIGLAVGLGIGIGLTWLDGRKQPAPIQVKVAEAPAPSPKPAPAQPPAYVEQTEPAPPEDEAPVVDTVPPAVVEPQPPAPQASLPQTTPPASVEPMPQSAEPGEAVPSAAQPEWLKNAMASVDPGAQPMIAIVLDDVGAAPTDVPGALGLPGPITLSIMTYAPNAAKIAAAAHASGHEIMVHVPMEPINRDADPGKNALLTNLSAPEIAERLDWGLSQFPGYVGINNHMGSKFTQDAAGMRVVIAELKARGLLFLDSRTIASSVGDKLAAELGVTHVQRDVFLDDVIDEADIMKELARTEAIAKKHGMAIAIGHPHPDTIAALRQWIPAAKAKGFVLVPVSAIAKKQNGVSG